MAEIDLLQTNRKYIDYAESNQHFLNLISKYRKEGQYIDSSQLKKKISKVATQLKSLTASQVEQWKEIHMIKLRELASFFTLNTETSLAKQSKRQEYAGSLREELHLIVEICRLMKLQYNSQAVAQVVQQFYFREYKNDVLGTMEQAGYNVNRFRMLYYEESSFFSFLCCWEPNGR